MLNERPQSTDGWVHFRRILEKLGRIEDAEEARRKGSQTDTTCLGCTEHKKKIQEKRWNLSSVFDLGG